MSRGIDRNRLDALWATYKSQPTLAVRDQLFHHYFRNVQYHATNVHMKVPFLQVDIGELITEGSIGLLDAIEKYQPGRGNAFATYCQQRIRGAILDYLRGLDWVPRLTRRRARRLETARSNLNAKLGRFPTDEELAAEMKLGICEFKQLRDGGVPVMTFPLRQRLSRDHNDSEGSETEVATAIADQSCTDPARAAELAELKQIISRGFSRAERLIIILFYFEDLTMKEIGAVIGISESRVSQIHSNLLQQLRARLGEFAARNRE